MPKSLISIQDFSKEEILHILDMAALFEKDRERSFLSGKVVACLFFEPSTRTRLSFEAAMLELVRKDPFTDKGRDFGRHDQDCLQLC